jgi:hypothetical protein
MTAIPVKDGHEKDGSEKDGSERDRLARARTTDLLWFSLGFMLGWGAFILRTNHLLPASADPILHAGEYAAVAVWAWAFARMAIHARRARQEPAMHAALHDEFYRSVQLRAARAAFKAVIAVNAAMMIAIWMWAPLGRLPAILPVQLTIWVAIAALAVATVVYDHE